MYNINEELKKRIVQLNIQLNNKYENILSLDREELRLFIDKNVGNIKSLKKLEKEKLQIYQDKGGIVGVDGSNNRIGGAYPHFVEIYQALGKSTIYKDKPLFKTDIYTPLYSENEETPLEEDREIQEKRNIKLSTLEVEVALESIDKLNPYGIIMDGSLIRYYIYAYEKWMELREKCEERGILLVGVIEDIKTSIIGDVLREIDKDTKECFYDREILFGALNFGEIISIKDSVNKKSPQGYSSIFMRTSLAPSVIGMDIIDSQGEYLEEMASLIFTLTPENSRGIPLWLDIIDKEVQISDPIIKALMERYLDRQLYERFFVAEREKR